MRSILVVEDSLAIREMVGFALKGEEFELTNAEDGLEALEVAKNKQFDLVITDHNMPNMLGLDMAEALRKMEGYQTTPILMLATESDPRLKEKGKAIGINGWVLKPLSPERFKLAINKLLNKA